MTLMRRYSKNGRYATIFFQLLFPAHLLAQQVSVSQDMVINRGLLDDKFWKDYPLHAQTERVIAYTDVGAAFSWKVFDQSFIYERKTINTLITNTNTLALSAREGAYSSQMNNGQIALQAQTKRYKYDSWGWHWTNASAHESFNWTITPKWIRLFDFREGDGLATLAKDDNTLSLHGDLSRSGTSSYGYDSNPAKVNFLNGGAIDISMQWESQSLKAVTQVQNFYSKIPVQSAYFSNRNYNINATTAQGITYSEVPSLRGTYGQQDMQLSLPKILKAEVAYKNVMANLWLKSGVVGIDGRNLPWIGAMYNLYDHQFEVKNYQMNNTQFLYRTPPFFKERLSGEIVITRDSSGSTKSLLGGVNLKF